MAGQGGEANLRPIAVYLLEVFDVMLMLFSIHSSILMLCVFVILMSCILGRCAFILHVII